VVGVSRPEGRRVARISSRAYGRHRDRAVADVIERMARMIRRQRGRARHASPPRELLRCYIFFVPSKIALNVAPAMIAPTIGPTIVAHTWANASGPP